MKKTLLLCIALVAALGTMAQTPQQLASVRLKKVLGDMIKNHKVISYDGLLDAYPYTDVREDGKVWDMYSGVTNYTFSMHTGNYNGEGDLFNREHSVPQSWFNKRSPMVSDLMQVIPTDGYVNNRRSNYPYGEVGSPSKYESAGGFSKLGPCVTSGYSGTVFEPNDEYKGDLARIYFYMATCYYEQIGDWEGVFGQKDKFEGFEGYPGIAEWQLKMLIRWAKQDPVSQKEIDRNNAVYQKQGNRNPFVDCPGLERFIWSEYAAE